MTLDIKNFYLNTPLEQYEYIRLKLNTFTEDVTKEYIPNENETKDFWVYV